MITILNSWQIIKSPELCASCSIAHTLKTLVMEFQEEEISENLQKILTSFNLYLNFSEILKDT